MHSFFVRGVMLFAVTLVPRLHAEIGLAGGRGGPFIEYHSNNLARIDPELAGNPIVIGGSGFGYASKQFRLGGGGGGGFLWNPQENTMFGMGYGGFIIEYGVNEWLIGRVLIGGGGFSVQKVIREDETTRVLKKISSGAFVLFYPMVSLELKLSGWMKLGITAGYFLPNVTRMQSLTTGILLLFGKV